MSDIRSSPRHRLLQVFLSGQGVFETYVSLDRSEFVCTCPGWRARRECKHIAYVTDVILQSDGAYGVHVTQDEPLDEPTVGDPVKFRDWVIRNAKVVTL